MEPEFRTCPHCGTEGILIMADGRCPHCKKVLLEADTKLTDAQTHLAGSEASECIEHKGPTGRARANTRSYEDHTFSYQDEGQGVVESSSKCGMISHQREMRSAHISSDCAEKPHSVHGTVERLKCLINRDLGPVALVILLPFVLFVIYLCKYVPVRWSTWGMVGLGVLILIVTVLSCLRALQTELQARVEEKRLLNVGKKERNRPTVFKELVAELAFRLEGFFLMYVACGVGWIFWNALEGNTWLSRVLDRVWRVSLIMRLLVLAFVLAVLVFLFLLSFAGFMMFLMGKRSQKSPPRVKGRHSGF